MTTEQKLAKLLGGGSVTIYNDCGNFTIERRWQVFMPGEGDLGLSGSKLVDRTSQAFVGAGYIPDHEQIAKAIDMLYDKDFGQVPV